MIVRRLAARGVVRTGSTEADTPRKRASRYLLIVFSAGAISGLAALIGIGPFGDLRAMINDLVYGGPGQIAASKVFPPVKPVHKVVDVYDPPPASRTNAPPGAAPASPRPTPTPSPRPSHSPRPFPSGSPPPDD